MIEYDFGKQQCLCWGICNDILMWDNLRRRR